MDTVRRRELVSDGVAVYPSRRHMPADCSGQIDLVGVPCGIDQHAPLSIDCLEAGCHVLCEKPAPRGPSADGRSRSDGGQRPIRSTDRDRFRALEEPRQKVS